jgi:hypothetical protein
MMAGVCSMEGERGEFAYKMIGGTPHLNMGIMGDRNIPCTCRVSKVFLKGDENSTHFPSGENLMSLTGFLKLK